jgi:uncharacterized damage-inducible protein DinB
VALNVGGVGENARVTAAFPEPTDPADSRTEVFLRYLAYFRARLVEKIGELPDAERRGSRLPSKWTPLELLKHLTFVELRWLEWGFAGQHFDEPWGEGRDGRWQVGDDDTFESLVADLAAQAQRSTAIITGHDLDEVGAPGDRWDGKDPATLERVLFHLMQEYARHVGQLDVVAELAGGSIGE